MILYCKNSLGCIDNNNIELINNGENNTTKTALKPNWKMVERKTILAIVLSVLLGNKDNIDHCIVCPS
jgi:hypothetical protein